jgi:hypothetical protein
MQHVKFFACIGRSCLSPLAQGGQSDINLCPTPLAVIREAGLSRPVCWDAANYETIVLTLMLVMPNADRAL